MNALNTQKGNRADAFPLEGRINVEGDDLNACLNEFIQLMGARELSEFRY
jgi:hypothetical protein